MNRRSAVKCQRATRTSPGSSPSDEEGVRRRLRGRRQRMCEAADSALDKDKTEGCDILDIIARSHDAEDVGVAGIVTDNGLEESDDDSASTCSSIVSGPSALDSATPKKLCPPPDLCPACLTLYENAMMDKTPIEDDMFIHDPTSLTCDEWVLLKKWTRGSNLEGRFLSGLQFGKHVEVRDSAGCSRPHPFLQRNLRTVTASANKPRGKKSRKKRTKSFQKRFSAKRQHLHRDNGSHLEGVGRTEASSNTSPDWHGLSGEMLFSCVAGKSSELRAAQSSRHREAPGFRKLLSQSRGSMVVKE